MADGVPLDPIEGELDFKFGFHDVRQGLLRGLSVAEEPGDRRDEDRKLLLLFCPLEIKCVRPTTREHHLALFVLRVKKSRPLDQELCPTLGGAVVGSDLVDEEL